MARRNTLTLLAATMLGTIDSNALVPIIALYAKAVGADLLQIGIIVGLFSAVHAPANLFFGRIADRFGRKLPLQVGLAWDAASLFLYSVATTPLLLALVRISHGIGSGFVGPSSMAIMADTSPRERKGRAMAVYGMALAFAVVIGFGMAGPIVARDGFAVLFYVLSGALVAGLVLATFVAEPPASPAKPMPWRRLLAYVQGPMPAAGYASIFALYFVLGAFVTLVPLHLQEELGASALVVGLSFAVFAVLSLLFHYPGGILADRYGPATPATIGLVAVAVAMALIPTVKDLPGLVALMVIFGVGHGFVFPAASTLVSREADPEQHGLVTGLFYALLVAGVAVGAPVMAALGSVTSTRVGIWASAWVSLVGIAFLARALIRPMPNRSSEHRLVATNAPK
ncbi:MAG: MFS transporter [Methanobacteriota archaeon]|nr:MAG: MFS transporter [Euryarchaeota archaeon]